MTKFISHIRATIKIILISLWLLLCLIPGVFTYHLSRKSHDYMIRLFFSGALKIMSIRVGQNGVSKITDDSVMYVSNHTSYLDILVLGSKMSVRFTPKIEISKWPIINFLVKMSLPVYIKRDVSKSLEQKNTIKEIVRGGDSVVLFPESTTNDGSKVLPFKSALFSVLEPDKSEVKKLENKAKSSMSSMSSEVASDDRIAVQPISIVYTHINGEPANPKNLDKVAWYGDMKFLPHFWNLLRARGARVKLMYHSGQYYENFGSRKALSKYCEEVITKGVDEIRNSPDDEDDNNGGVSRLKKRFGKH